jgi:hypothetical protein
MECPIWGTEAECLAQGDFSIVNSARAGGSYGITGTAAAMATGLSVEQKALLTTWIADQRRAGDLKPTVTSEVVKRAIEGRPLAFGARIGRFFEYMSRRDDRIGKRFMLTDSNRMASSPLKESIAAWCECIGGEEVMSLLRLLAADGSVNLSSDQTYFEINPIGYIKIDEAGTKAGASSRGFVAMWFDDSLVPARDQGLLPAIRNAGYDPIHLAVSNFIDQITDEIIAQIRGSRFVVADFTCALLKNGSVTIDQARGSVYYEAGFAKGLGLPVFWTCREDCRDFLHFDVAQYPHLLWKEPADLMKGLTDRIVAVLGRGPVNFAQ